MAIRVTKQFKDDFDLVSGEWIAQGEWTPEEVDGLKDLMRKYELADGPDRLRDQLVHYVKGEIQLSAIDDPKERYNFWASYFEDEAKQIRERTPKETGINQRIRARIEKEREEMGIAA